MLKTEEKIKFKKMIEEDESRRTKVDVASIRDIQIF
jgi:hypothetical protein